MEFPGQYQPQFQGSNDAFGQYLSMGDPLTPSRSQSAPSDEHNLAMDQTQGFYYGSGFSASNQDFTGPPTPPNQQSQSQHANQAGLPSNHTTGGGEELAGPGKGGSDDDESMTPAQTRRKAQNRAA